MNKKILITGATGFVGNHLVELLIKDGAENIFGTYYSESSLLSLGDNKNKIEAIKADLRNQSEVSDLISKIKPDFLYHLAAFTSPSESFESPNETVINNISSEINLLEEIKKNDLKDTKILIISSAEVYGLVSKEDLPIDENVQFNPTNPYAVSKLAQDFLGRQYFLAHNLKIIRVRPFNHIGPGQSPNFVVSSFAKKIAEIEKGKREPILPTGNLNTKRDFTDVRDTVKAYTLLMEKGESGEVYNVGSGASFKISEILNMLLSYSESEIKVESDKSLLRPIDNPDLVCDYSKLSALTGWKPTIQIEKTLRDTLDYWRNII